MRVLEIAGSSAGGSSYTHRILRELNQASPHTPLNIRIGGGAYQQQVQKAVQKSIEEVECFLRTYSGQKFYLNIRITIE